MLGDAKDKFECGLVYLFAILASAGIAPFSLVRYFKGEYVAAVLDLVIALVAIASALITYRRGRVTPAVSYTTAGLYSAGAVAVVYMHGPSFALWLSPTIIANFFLLNSRPALLLNSTLILAVLPAALRQDKLADIFSMLSSLIMSGSMAFVFSLLTNKQHQLLQNFANQDPLTKLENRRAMIAEMTRCAEDFERSQIPSILIVVDLDFFKSINDKFGHGEGDEVLKNVAGLLRNRVRKTDRVFRFGGEEFVVLARNTGKEGGAVIAEQLRQQIEAKVKIPDSAVTASFGCAELHEGESTQDWFNRADLAVYQAKQTGRNRVVISE